MHPSHHQGGAPASATSTTFTFALQTQHRMNGALFLLAVRAGAASACPAREGGARVSHQLQKKETRLKTPAANSRRSPALRPCNSTAAAKKGADVAAQSQGGQARRAHGRGIPPGVPTTCDQGARERRPRRRRRQRSDRSPFAVHEKSALTMQDIRSPIGFVPMRGRERAGDEISIIPAFKSYLRLTVQVL